MCEVESEGGGRGGVNLCREKERMKERMEGAPVDVKQASSQKKKMQPQQQF